MGIDGIKESKDSLNKKLVFQVPYSEVDKLSGLIKHFEDHFPELFIDVEMNSLEDAYISMVEGGRENGLSRSNSVASMQD